MIGIGHVFKIAEPISFIIKNSWPDAVLVELDEKRLNLLTTSAIGGKGKADVPRLYRESARYQEQISAENGVHTGDEFLAAVNSGRMAGADIICIDKDAQQVMKEIEEGMSFKEKTKYYLNTRSDGMSGSKKVQLTRENFIANEQRYIEGMRKRYPTLVRKLIDERDAYMADRIREASARYENIVIVVGDAHVEGICRILSDLPIEKIRLADLMDKERMDRIRSRIWNGERGPQ